MVRAVARVVMAVRGKVRVVTAVARDVRVVRASGLYKESGKKEFPHSCINCHG